MRPNNIFYAAEEKGQGYWGLRGYNANSNGDEREIRYVQTVEEVVENIRRFQLETSMQKESKLPIPTGIYYTYDPVSGWFAPAKFSGIADMTIKRYKTYMKQQPKGFDGGLTHQALRRVCGEPVKKPEVIGRFKAWLADWNEPYKDNMTVFSAGEVVHPPVLESFCQEIRSINVDKSSGYRKPYKPLLVLAAIKTILEGEQLTFGEPLLSHYRSLADAIGANASNPHYPYFHMVNDGFWQVLNSNGSQFFSPSTPNKSDLLGTTAQFIGQREECIRDYRLRPFVIEAVRLHFDDSQWEQLAAVWPELIIEPKPSVEPVLWRSPRHPEPAPIQDLSQIATQFAEALRSSHIVFGSQHDEFVRAFIASLSTKRFVILTGLSGSGKTQIALQFGNWLGEGKSKIVPVRPDWTGAEALFGYEDALQPLKDGRRAWFVPEALEFMLLASRDPEHPYLLILDEMNLAHVERYFADVLSGMESEEPCLPNLRNEEGYWRWDPEDPDKLPFPRNLFVVGTVNVDETTYMFSAKVLDRANTIEFRVSPKDLLYELRKPVPCGPGTPGLVRGVLSIAADHNWHLDHPHPEKETFVQHFRQLHTILFEEGFEFGHRVLYEAVRFAAMLYAAGDGDVYHALDLQVKQKVLPRLHGGRRRLEPVLISLGQFCFDPNANVGSDNEGVPFDPLNPPGGKDPLLPLSFEKVKRMMRNLRANQFASFAE